MVVLQIFAATASGVAALYFLLLIVGPVLSAAFRGKGFRLNQWHGVGLTVALTVFLSALVLFGWWKP